MNDRITDPRLQMIIDSMPPAHIGGFLRGLFGLEISGFPKTLGTVDGFCEQQAVEKSEVVALLEERDILMPEMAEKLQKYFGFQDDGLLMRLQQSAYLDRVVKH